MPPRRAGCAGSPASDALGAGSPASMTSADEDRPDTGPGKAVDEHTPEPEEHEGGTLGRDEGEGAPSPGEPGNVEDAQLG
jgi:hypothetical protein